MRAAERYDRIERIVNEAGSVSIATLKKHFPDISDMTLRRDLEALNKAERVIRIHGGARSIQSTIGAEDNYPTRAAVRIESKRQIARRAVELLRENTAIFIDSGTTITEFCKLFPDGRYLIYTTGLYCALDLQRLQLPEIYLLGGRLSRTSVATNGADAVSCIENVHFMQAFLGSSGYDELCGFTCENAEDARLKKEVIRRSEQTVILMDSSKVGRISTYTFAQAADVNVVIGDEETDAETIESFSQVGIEFLK